MAETAELSERQAAELRRLHRGVWLKASPTKALEALWSAGLVECLEIGARWPTHLWRLTEAGERAREGLE